MAEQCHAAGVIFVFACSWTKVAQVDKFRGHFFAFASSLTKVAQADKFRGHFFGFASSWTKVAQADIPGHAARAREHSPSPMTFGPGRARAGPK